MAEESTTQNDVIALIAGAGAWASVIPLVSFAGQKCVEGGTNTQVIFLVFGVGLAAITTPLLSSILGWKTRSARIRGIALALGMAQTLDGIVHTFYPAFYSNNPYYGIAAAGNIFWGAGLLGIFSVFT